MNQNQQAEERLRCYASRKRALTAIPHQIQELRLRRESISGQPDNSPVLGGGDREQFLTGSLVKEENLRTRLDLTRLWVEEVDDALALLSEEERKLLDAFYIHPERGNPERMMDELGVEHTTVYRRKSRALTHFADGLYGWEEDAP